MGLFDAFRSQRPPDSESTSSSKDALSGELLQELNNTSTSTSELLSNHEVGFASPTKYLLLLVLARVLRKRFDVGAEAHDYPLLVLCLAYSSRLHP